MSTRKYIMITPVQKQLKRENITYRMLLEKAKKGIAVKRLAQGNIPLVDIAFLLAFQNKVHSTIPSSDGQD